MSNTGGRKRKCKDGSAQTLFFNRSALLLDPLLIMTPFQISFPLIHPFYFSISFCLTKYGNHTTKSYFIMMSEKVYLEESTLSDVCCSAGSPPCTDVCASVCDCSFMASVSWWWAVGFVCSVAEGYSKLHKKQRAQQKTPAFLAEVTLQTPSVCTRRKGGNGEGGRSLVSETLQSGAGLFTDVFGPRR